MCFYFPYEYNAIHNNTFIEEGDGRYNIEFKRLNEIVLVINVERGLLNEEIIGQNINARCFGIDVEVLIEKKKIINIYNG